jgi:hypothetical protein
LITGQSFLVQNLEEVISFVFIIDFPDVTAQGGEDGAPQKLALLSVRMVLWDSVSEQFLKHTYSVISEDIKEDTFHAWAHFRAVLMKVLFCNKFH